MEEHKYLTKYKKLNQQIHFKDTEMRLAQGNSAVGLSFFFFFWPCHAACGILVPPPGIETLPPILEARSLNYWTAGEVPTVYLFTFSAVKGY